VQRSVFGQFINVTACDRCRGEGWIIPTPCTHCRGTGRERVMRTLEVRVPAGVDNGSQIRLTGEGELGTNGGPRGSTYVILRVAAHRIFERMEDDLHVQLNVSFAQAALGDEIEVPTLEGEQKLKILSGTQSGEVLTLRNKGIAHLRGGGRGDLFVHVQVITPKKLSGEQKKLVEQLAKSMESDDGSRNLFEKFRDVIGG
jgi:molecular chaperone DnaJ